MTKTEAQEAVQKHGSIRGASKALGVPYSTLHGALHRDGMPMVAKPVSPPGQKIGRSLDEFKAAHDKSFIVPMRLKAALKALGNGWEYEVALAKQAGVSLADLGNFRDQFSEHIVVVKRDGSKRAWAGTPAAAAKMRAMLT